MLLRPCIAQHAITRLAAATLLAVLLSAPGFTQTNCEVPASEIPLPPKPTADTGQGVIFSSFICKTYGCAAATDLQGNSLWTYCVPYRMVLTRVVPGGSVLMINDDKPGTDFAVREMSLTGTVLHAIGVPQVNAQLASKGQQPIIDFDHEVIRLPNGYTAFISHDERLETNVQGPGTVDVMGDEVIVLDTNWKVVWSWNAFDFLPVTRKALLGETCQQCVLKGNPRCCPITLAATANDWLHCNSLAYDSSDGNLIVSVRSQDWVIKIAYQNGAGDGHLVWTLGQGGNFTMLNTPGIPSPWFSHQHDAEVQATVDPKLIMLFDNGNTRHATDRTAKSRGQVLSINEQTMQADIYLNYDFSVYSPAYGTAQLLDNGDYWFLAGTVNGVTYPAQAVELQPSGFSGLPNYGIEYMTPSYRSVRMTSLYGF